MKAKSSKPIDIQAERLRKLLRDLVDIYSPTGKEEEAVEYAERHLKKHGIAAIRQEVDENRFNLLVLPDRTERMELCFVGHLDTISAHDTEDYSSSQEGDTVLGLGTADMKAGCAAMIEAFTTIASMGGTFPPVGLALVVGEEEDSIGAKEVVREYSFPWAIIGEPTNMVPCLGHYGYLEVLLRTIGKRVHSSMPELGQNAIEAMLKLLLQVTQYATSSSHELVYNVRQLTSFPGGFVVPDTCEAWLDLHLPPNSKIDVLKTELEQLIKVAENSISGLDCHLKFEETHAGYRISEGRPFVEKLKAIYQKMSLTWEPQDFRSHSDGNVLWAAGVDSIILGPGRLDEAHTPKESVSFTQVTQAARLYLNIALSLQESVGAYVEN